jgi:hypothetical protein
VFKVKLTLLLLKLTLIKLCLTPPLLKPQPTRLF